MLMEEAEKSRRRVHGADRIQHLSDGVPSKGGIPAQDISGNNRNPPSNTCALSRLYTRINNKLQTVRLAELLENPATNRAGR